MDQEKEDEMTKAPTLIEAAQKSADALETFANMSPYKAPRGFRDAVWAERVLKARESLYDIRAALAAEGEAQQPVAEVYRAHYGELYAAQQPSSDSANQLAQTLRRVTRAIDLTDDDRIAVSRAADIIAAQQLGQN